MADSLRHALDELGRKSADEIADYFRAQGVKGYIGSAGACPVANHLRAVLGCETVKVGTSLATNGVVR